MRWNPNRSILAGVPIPTVVKVTDFPSYEQFTDPEEDRCLCHSVGAPQVQADAPSDQGGHETGSTGSIGRTPSSSPTGHYVMATAEHREPCESRGSCTVLEAPGGETPPGDSTLPVIEGSRDVGIPPKAAE